MLAHQHARGGAVDALQLAAFRHAQHGPLAEQVDVAADERLGVGAQQRDHRLVQGNAVVTGQLAGDARQGLAAAYRRQGAVRRRRLRHGRRTRRSGRGDRGRGRRGLRRCGWRGCRCRQRCRLAHDQVGRGRRRRLDHRLGDRGGGLRRGDQRGVFAHQPPLPPVDLDQEAQRRHLYRRRAGHPDHRPPLRILGELELQFADQPLRARQADALEGRRRRQPHRGALQLARVAGDHRNLGHQRLPRPGQDADVAQAEGKRGAAVQPQREHQHALYRARRAPAPWFHAGKYTGTAGFRIPRGRHPGAARCRPTVCYANRGPRLPLATPPAFGAPPDAGGCVPDAIRRLRYSGPGVVPAWPLSRRWRPARPAAPR